MVLLDWLKSPSSQSFNLIKCFANLWCEEFYEGALEVAQAPSVAQLAQRLRLDLANTFARDGEQFDRGPTQIISPER